MKTGQKISIMLLHSSGRKVEAIGILRVEGAQMFVDIPNAAFKKPLDLDLIADFIEPHVGESEFRYRGEFKGGIMVPDFLWK
jgi:hypothetical protein